MLEKDGEYIQSKSKKGRSDKKVVAIEWQLQRVIGDGRVYEAW